MKYEIKKLWVAALLSGHFVQGRNKLRTQGKICYAWCCLGVLCELHREVTGRGRWTEMGYVAMHQDGTETLPYATVLPQPVLQWAGLGDNPTPMVGDTTLAVLNDGDDPDLGGPHKTFHAIAEIIDSQL